MTRLGQPKLMSTRLELLICYFVYRQRATNCNVVDSKPDNKLVSHYNCRVAGTHCSLSL